MKRLRIYADTSVFGGCFDEEFSKESRLFMKRVIDFEIILVISNLVLDELEAAPIHVKGLLNKIHQDSVEYVSLTYK